MPPFTSKSFDVSFRLRPEEQAACSASPMPACCSRRAHSRILRQSEPWSPSACPSRLRTRLPATTISPAADAMERPLDSAQVAVQGGFRPADNVSPPLSRDPLPGPSLTQYACKARNTVQTVMLGVSHPPPRIRTWDLPLRRARSMALIPNGRRAGGQRNGLPGVGARPYARHRYGQSLRARRKFVVLDEVADAAQRIVRFSNTAISKSSRHNVPQTAVALGWIATDYFADEDSRGCNAIPARCVSRSRLAPTPVLPGVVRRHVYMVLT